MTLRSLKATEMNLKSVLIVSINVIFTSCGTDVGFGLFQYGCGLSGILCDVHHSYNSR
jgi:hypothetical protein